MVHNVRGRCSAKDAKLAASLFVPEGYLRDLVALTWHLRTLRGRESIETALSLAFDREKPSQFALHPEVPVRTKRTAAGADVVEAIACFSTTHGISHAILRLTRDSDGVYRAWLLATALHELTGHEAQVGANRRMGTPSLDTFADMNWAERRMVSMQFADREPEVVVVGAGQCGLSVAARLRVLGVDTLVVERSQRVGDVWRNRYHSLTLHNPTWLNHLPFMPFPDTFPLYLSKDQLANWFESYADAMELNVWTETQLVSGIYKEDAGIWELTLRTQDGERVVRPPHVVMATGTSAAPRRVRLPGIDSFQGKVLHTHDYQMAHRLNGANVVIFGTGNSGHDVAQDLVLNAHAHVTMIQRTSTTIVNISTVQDVYERFSASLPPDVADFSMVASPYDEVVHAFQGMTAIAKRRDRQLVELLHAAGFRTDYGEDESGHQMKYLRYGGGYYINVGCSDLIATGKIPIVQYDNVRSIVENGVALDDGKVLPADAIILATGYEGQLELVKQIFGAETADRIGGTWGYDEEGEMRSMFKRTGQPGLWFHAGAFSQARIMSKYVALQIKACLEGIIEPSLDIAV